MQGIGKLYSSRSSDSHSSVYISTKGKVIMLQDEDLIWSIDPVNPKDEVVDVKYIYAPNLKIIQLLVNKATNMLHIRQISIGISSKVGIDWSTYLGISYETDDFSIPRITLIDKTIYIFTKTGKLLVMVNQNNGIILEINKILENSSENFILLFKRKSIEVLTHSSSEIIHSYLNSTIKDNMNIINRFKIPTSIQLIIYDSSIIINKNETWTFSCLVVNSNLRIQLLTINLSGNSEVSVHLNNLNLEVNMNQIKPLKLTNFAGDELAITLNNNTNILKGFVNYPVISQNMQNPFIIYSKEGDHYNLFSLSYCDLSKSVDIQVILNFKFQERNQPLNFNLKFDNKAINHGNIHYVSMISSSRIIIQWQDYLIGIIEIDCNITGCQDPIWINFYEEGFLLSKAEKNKYTLYTPIDYKDNLINLANLKIKQNILTAKHIYMPEAFRNESSTNGNLLFIINTGIRRVYAFNITSGRLLWVNSILEDVELEQSILLKYNIYLVDSSINNILKSDNPFLIVVAGLNIYKINIFNGEIMDRIKVNEIIGDYKFVMISSYRNIGRPLINPKLLVIGDTNKPIQVINFGQSHTKSEFYSDIFILYNKRSISGYMLNKSGDIKHIWEFTLNFSRDSNEEIEIMTTPQCPDCKGIPAIVTVDSDIVHKYDNPNLLFILSNKLKVFIIDGLTGNLHYTTILPEILKHPFTVSFHSNIIILTAFHSLHQTQVIITFEMYYEYDKSDIELNYLNKIKSVILYFTTKEPSKIWDSEIIQKNPFVIQTQILYPFESPITSATISNTAESITPKMLLIASKQGGIIEGIPEEIISPRRPNPLIVKSEFAKAIEIKEYPAYKPVESTHFKIPINVFSIEEITTIPDMGSESTSILVCFGTDSLLVLSFQPSTPFDNLPKDFKKSNIIAALFLSTFITVATLIKYKLKSGEIGWN
ncbi:hypothetical protein cand_032960 [Cryptosporidium andersoni]|uniref:ER membrane protein complex subunit 1 n=1 Tax=Cryptosporidium andersoni TaxID=117008 RepID=A0A1J4MC88_9CRYT|nr:hypothetical protein cand_032960 [Cryptosporidium andersoni]